MSGYPGTKIDVCATDAYVYCISNMAYLYFVSSNGYGKFGHSKACNSRFAAYTSTNPSYTYSVIRYNCVLSSKLLDNYINDHVLLKGDDKSLVKFKVKNNKILDWFVIDNTTGMRIITFMEKLRVIDDEGDYNLFIQGIRYFLKDVQKQSINFFRENYNEGGVVLLADIIRHPKWKHEYLRDADTNFVNMCKSCEQRALKGCCPQYSPKNRKKLKVVVGWHITRANAVSTKINGVIGSNANWDVKYMDELCYKLTPETTQCCVYTNYYHSEAEHSCIFVRKSSVIAYCFRHGKRVVNGALSRSIREIFFEFKSENAIETMVELVLSRAEKENLVRENGNVLKNYKPIASYEEFIQDVLTDNEALIEQPRRFNSMITYMKKVDNSRFPLVKRNRKYIGFSNGLLDIVSGELVSNDVLTIGEGARHYINQQFGTDDLDTPMFDKLVKHQLENDELYTYMLAFIGRLFYDVGKFDRFDVVPFVAGDIGKSTLISVIRSMFEPSSVGSLDLKRKTIVDISSLYDKEIIVVPDVNDKMANQLSSDVFRMMVCGERVQHATKWRAQLFMCGDCKVPISRHFAVFRFDKYVADVDGSLKKKIIECELSKVIAKCLKAYRILLDYTSAAGFWNTCPSCFKNTNAIPQ